MTIYGKLRGPQPTKGKEHAVCVQIETVELGENVIAGCSCGKTGLGYTPFAAMKQLVKRHG